MAMSLAPSPATSVASGARPQLLPELDQRGELGLAPDDRLGHLAGQPAVAIEQERVGAVLVEADHGGDAPGEQREAAGDQAGMGAVLAQGRDQRAGAGREADPLRDDLVDDRGRRPLSSATRSRSAGANSISPRMARSVMAATCCLSPT